jgi:hypothetical protein
MSNKTQLRARLRDELGDTGATVLWSDTRLDGLLNGAVSWYARIWPAQLVEQWNGPEGGERLLILKAASEAWTQYDEEQAKV